MFFLNKVGMVVQKPDLPSAAMCLLIVGGPLWEQKVLSHQSGAASMFARPFSPGEAVRLLSFRLGSQDRPSLLPHLGPVAPVLPCVSSSLSRSHPLRGIRLGPAGVTSLMQSGSFLKTSAALLAAWPAPRACTLLRAHSSSLDRKGSVPPGTSWIQDGKSVSTSRVCPSTSSLALVLFGMTEFR